MQVTFEKLDKVNVIAHISVPASDVNPIYNNVVAKYKQGGSVPGFRKGKTPEKLILSKYAVNIAEDVAHQLIDSSLKQALNEEGFAKCISRPTVVTMGQVKSDCDFNYDVKFEVFPEDYQAKPLNEIAVEKVVFSVTDEEVEQMVSVLREQHSSEVEVEGDATVSDKHIAYVKFVGSIGDEKFEGGSAENFRIDMSKPESMIPGFIEQIKGHKLGETFNIEATFPEDYGHEPLQGKTATFEITINKICDVVLPSDEELCKKFGTESMEECKKSLRINMAREGSAYCSRTNWHAVTVAVGEANKECEMPPSLVEATKENLVENHVEGFARRMLGGKADDKRQAKMMDNLRKHFAEVVTDEMAQEKALQTHFLRDYVAQEKIYESLTPEVVEKATEEYLAVEASAYDESDEYIAEIKGNKAELDRVHTIVENQMILEALFAKMNVTVKTLSFEDISRAMQMEAMRNPLGL